MLFHRINRPLWSTPLIWKEAWSETTCDAFWIFVLVHFKTLKPIMPLGINQGATCGGSCRNSIALVFRKWTPNRFIFTLQKRSCDIFMSSFPLHFPVESASSNCTVFHLTCMLICSYIPSVPMITKNRMNLIFNVRFTRLRSDYHNN